MVWDSGRSSSAGGAGSTDAPHRRAATTVRAATIRSLLRLRRSPRNRPPTARPEPDALRDRLHHPNHDTEPRRPTADIGSPTLAEVRRRLEWCLDGAVGTVGPWICRAERAGVDVAYIERLIEAGIFHPGAGDTFSLGDVRRVGFVRNLELADVPLEGWPPRRARARCPSPTWRPARSTRASPRCPQRRFAS